MSDRAGEAGSERGIAGARTGRKIPLIVAILALTACSSRTTYREENGRCIERDRQRIVGLTWLDNEYPARPPQPCAEDAR